MEQVAIGSQNYDSYASEAAADLYLDAAMHATNWWVAEEATKARALVTATRILDRQIWRDEYNTQALRIAEPNIVTAAIELALVLVDGTDIQNQQTTEDLVRSMSAGSVSITFVRGSVIATRFNQIVQELLAGYLGGSNASLYAKSFGTEEETAFPIDLGFTA